MGVRMIAELKQRIGGQLLHVLWLLGRPAAAEENGRRCFRGDQLLRHPLVVLAHVPGGARVEGQGDSLLVPRTVTHDFWRNLRERRRRRLGRAGQIAFRLRLGRRRRMTRGARLLLVARRPRLLLALDRHPSASSQRDRKPQPAVDSPPHPTSWRAVQHHRELNRDRPVSRRSNRTLLPSDAAPKSLFKWSSQPSVARGPKRIPRDKWPRCALALQWQEWRSDNRGANPDSASGPTSLRKTSTKPAPRKRSIHARSSGKNPLVFSLRIGSNRSIGRCAMLKSPQAISSRPLDLSAVRYCRKASRKRIFCTW